MNTIKTIAATVSLAALLASAPAVAQYGGSHGVTFDRTECSVQSLTTLTDTPEKCESVGGKWTGTRQADPAAQPIQPPATPVTITGQNSGAKLQECGLFSADGGPQEGPCVDSSSSAGGKTDMSGVTETITATPYVNAIGTSTLHR